MTYDFDEVKILFLILTFFQKKLDRHSTEKIKGEWRIVPEQYQYNIAKEGDDNILRINVESLPYIPSIEDNAAVMAKTVDILTETAQVSKIVFIQKRDYEYDFYETQLLVEIAQLYKRLSKQKELFEFHAVASNFKYQKFFHLEGI